MNSNRLLLLLSSVCILIVAHRADNVTGLDANGTRGPVVVASGTHDGVLDGDVSRGPDIPLSAFREFDSAADRTTNLDAVVSETYKREEDEKRMPQLDTTSRTLGRNLDIIGTQKPDVVVSETYEKDLNGKRTTVLDISSEILGRRNLNINETQKQGVTSLTLVSDVGTIMGTQKPDVVVSETYQNDLDGNRTTGLDISSDILGRRNLNINETQKQGASSLTLDSGFTTIGSGTPDVASETYDTDSYTTLETHWVDAASEAEAFRSYGVCLSENVTFSPQTCFSTKAWRRLSSIKFNNCHCDDLCKEYGDCCIDRLKSGPRDRSNAKNTDGWTCRDVIADIHVERCTDSNNCRVPLYVHQKCPDGWTDGLVRGLCEEEAVDRHKNSLYFDHLQDIPVLAEASRVFYRNVYCSICNGDTDLVKWSTYVACDDRSTNRTEESRMDESDFSMATYNPATMMYHNVLVEEKSITCQVKVQNFLNHRRLLDVYGARICKPVIDTCAPGTDDATRRKCEFYSSYVYLPDAEINNKRKVFKNFNCALCNGVNVTDLVCLDPYVIPAIAGPHLTSRPSLAMLFDMNLEIGSGGGGAGSRPCRLSDGRLWDPILRRCHNVTCGKLYERQGTKCALINDSNPLVGDLKEDCLKVTLDSSDFYAMTDGNLYINTSQQLLSSGDFEVVDKNGTDVMKISVCISQFPHLLPVSNAQIILTIITLTVSIICLILHLWVYGIFKKLRNCPGKVLMSLSSSLLCGHLFLLMSPHFLDLYWVCYLTGVAIHFGYLSAFTWMSVMAFDIRRTFSANQTRSTKKSKLFIKYSLYAWTTSSAVIALSVTIDNLLDVGSAYRPKYGDPVCWINQPRGLLLFFVAPATLLFAANVAFFSATAFSIQKVSRQTKMVGNFSDRTRYFLYLKLCSVLGLAWLVGIVAGFTGLDLFWYPFIVLNGLQGALIFASFTLKRNVLHMVAVKFKVRSDKYRVSHRTGLKAAMYSSLSNLTSNTLSTAVPVVLPDKVEMLKAVRKIGSSEAVQKIT